MTAAPARVAVVAAYEVGGTFLKAGLVAPGGDRLLDEVKLHTPPSAPELFDELLRIHVRFREAAARHRTTITEVGLAVPTAVDPRTGDLATCGNLPDLAEFPWAHRLRAATGARVVVMNDGRAALLGEAAHGAARGVSDVCLVVVGTGVGASFMVGGHVVHGRRGAAGEVGYMPFLDPYDGPLSVRLHETLGARALLDEAHAHLADRGDRPRPTLRELLEDEEGPDLRRAVARRITGTLLVLDSVLASTLYVLGGGVGAGPAVVDAVRAELVARGASYMRVVPSALRDRAGLLGLATRAARDHEPPGALAGTGGPPMRGAPATRPWER